MPISMSSSARYVTQANVWSSHFTGPLTDRRIAAWQKRGYYSNGLAVRQTGRRQLQARQKLIQTLIGDYT